MKKIIFAIFILPFLISTDVLAHGTVYEGSHSSTSFSPWLSDKAYSRVGGFSFGYVNQYARTYGSSTGGDIKRARRFIDGIWSDGFDQRIHGGFIGFTFQHQLGNSGLSIYWALRTGFYYSKKKDEEYPILMDYSTRTGYNWVNYYEWTFNLPLHLQFSIPLGEGAVGFHTGPAYTCYIMGRYVDEANSNKYDAYQQHDEPRSAFFYEIACFYQTASSVRFDFTWSQGLTKRMYWIRDVAPGNSVEYWSSYNRNKFMAGMTLFF